MDTLVVICFSLVFGLLGLLAFLLARIRNSPEEEVCLSSDTPDQQPTTSRATASSPNELRVGSKVIKSRNQKAPARRTPAGRAPEEENDQDDENDSENGEQPHNSTQSSTSPLSPSVMEGKIGKKKLQKLEMKAEKRAAREQELQMREEKRLQKEKDDELQQQLEEEREAREKEKEEEEKRLAAEQKQREYEKYLKAKKAFIVEEEGFEANVESGDTQNKLADFINYIKEKKIVMLEELAGEFKMKTQDVITRIQELLDSEEIDGVIDDRGKFIYITSEELNSVAKFIRQNGRVSITDLVENSNRLIQLQNKK